MPSLRRLPRRRGAALAMVLDLALVPMLMLMLMLMLLCAAAVLLPLPARAAADCGAALDARARRVIEGPRQRLAFAPVPAPLASGRHFALDIEVCPRAAGATAPLALRVDADMPAHRHGMNYRPTVRALGEGRYRADGLLLHMAGRWRFVFELSAEGRIERLTQELEVE